MIGILVHYFFENLKYASEEEVVLLKTYVIKNIYHILEEKVR